MKTFKALYIANGVIKAGEFPEESDPWRFSSDEEIRIYQQALASAKANAVECEDQEEAAKVLAESEISGELFILPSGWDYVEKVRVCTGDCTCDKPCIVRVVAKLYHTDEQTKTEELRKKLHDFLATQTKEQLEKWLEMDRERMKQPEPEESQDKLWMNVIILVGQNIDRQGPSKVIQQLEEQFTITRRK